MAEDAGSHGFSGKLSPMLKPAKTPSPEKTGPFGTAVRGRRQTGGAGSSGRCGGSGRCGPAGAAGGKAVGPAAAPRRLRGPVGLLPSGTAARDGGSAPKLQAGFADNVTGGGKKEKSPTSLSKVAALLKCQLRVHFPI